MFVDDHSDNIKLIDFGLSKKINGDSHYRVLNSMVGTPYYVAPEVLNHAYDERCDIWSIGVVLYILLCGYPPFNGKSSKELTQKIKQGLLEFDEEDW